MKQLHGFLVGAWLVAATGCASLDPAICGPARAPSEADTLTPGNSRVATEATQAACGVPGPFWCWGPCSPACQPTGPKTLFSWEICKENGTNRAEPQNCAASDKSQTGTNGANQKNNGQQDVPEPPSEIATDRPDFTESNTNVGLGRIQLEMGYTYSRNREQGIRNAHSYPEALLRIGLFADWFEFRVGQNFSSSRALVIHSGALSTNGGEDLYLGIGLGLTEQQRFLPESRIIIQTTVPTGPADLSAGRMLPGLNLCYGWDVTEWVNCGASTQGNAAVDDDGHPYVELAQSFTIGYTLTKKLAAFTEAFALFPSGAVAPGTWPEYYFDGGFTYKFTPNLQYDIRAGVGLNQHADDFFVGSGLSFRF